MSTLMSRWLERADDPSPAIADDAGDHSYASVVAGSLAVARALLATDGAKAGDRFALLAEPGAAFVHGFFGILLAGGSVIVLSPLHPAPETAYFAKDGGVRVALVTPTLAAHAAALDPSTVTRIDLEEIGRRGSLSPEELARLADAARAIDERSPALQLYTSGTTGKPKGAIITHENLAVQQRLVGEAWGFGPGDRLLHTLPLHHMHGLAIALLTALGARAATRLTTFDARASWEAMESATVFMGVPAMYQRLLAAFDDADANTRARWGRNARALRLATSGSAALPVTLAERWRAITGAIPLERFGMTEIGVGLTNPLDGERRAGCVGLPLPTVETRIVRDDGQDAGDGESGELWIRGPSVFAGYHERPEETARAFVSDPSGLPWFRTGDTVTRDDASAGKPFRILGRTSVDILKSGGYKLSALEIEETLREHPSVGEAAVVGVPDDAWGDRVVACVVLRQGAEICDAAALRAFVRSRLAPYKVPKDIVFRADLPRNALGKVVKPTLVALLRDETANDASTEAQAPTTATPT